MKKNIYRIFIILFINFLFPLFVLSSTNDTLSIIENNLYGFDYSKDNNVTRIERLEASIYGRTKSGDIFKRIDNLSNDISADVLGFEISPKEDSFAEENTNTQEDNSVNYPIVNEIEQKLFNKVYSTKDFHTRIVTIEKKLFGKVYDIDDYSTRMDRIKAEIMPETLVNSNRFKHEYRDNKIYSDDLASNNLSRYGNIYGQQNYSRPYNNYGDNYSTGGASSPVTVNNLDKELAELEFETFGTEFSNEDSSSRIKRLNSVNKAKKSSSKYDSQKFSQRMSTAMEIGAMILMILAMVL